MTGVKISAPVPAPRRSRSSDPMDTSTPSAPERRKKKAAPPPPVSGGGSNPRLREDKRPMKNSTLISSTTSLLKVEDISPVRPASSLSNLSLSSSSTSNLNRPSSSMSNLSLRSNKKRKAPPPPLAIISPIKEEKTPIHAPSSHNQDQDPPSPDPAILNPPRYSEIYNDEKEEEEKEERKKKKKGKKEEKEKNEKKNKEKVVDRIESNEDRVEYKREEENDEIIEIIIENESSEILVENGDIYSTVNKRRKDKNETGVDKSETNPGLTNNTIIQHSQEMTVESSIEISNIPVTSESLERKKKKDKEKKEHDDSKPKKKKKSKSKERREDEEDGVKLDLEEIPNFRMIRAADVHQVGSSGVKTESRDEMEKDSEPEELVEDYELFDMEADPGKFRERETSQDNLEQKKKKKEKKDKKEKKAKKEKKQKTDRDTKEMESKEFKENETMSEENEKSKSENEITTKTPGNKPDDKDESSGKDDKSAEFQASDLVPTIQEGSENISESLYLTAEDESGDEKGNQDKEDKDSTEEDAEDKIGPMRRMTGKEREDEVRQKISMDMRARSNRRASQGGDVLAAQLQTETIRQQLRIISEDSPLERNETVWRREPGVVHLEIDSEDDLLPTINSSRSNSVVEISDTDEIITISNRQELERMELELRTERGRRNEISRALDESYTKISLEHSSVTGTDGSSDQSEHFSLKNENILSNAYPSPDNELYHEKNIKSPPSPPPPTLPFTYPLPNHRSVSETIKSPSPDSGIHDFAETCSPPLSLQTNEDSNTDIEEEKEPKPHISVLQTRDWAENGKELASLRVASQGNDAFAPGFTGSLKTNDSERPQEEIQDEDKVEKVELPRQHALGKVLFSMSSYRERDDPKINHDKRQSLNLDPFSQKLNSSLASKQERMKTSGSMVDIRLHNSHAQTSHRASSGSLSEQKQTDLKVKANHSFSGSTSTLSHQSFLTPRQQVPEEKPIIYEVGGGEEGRGVIKQSVQVQSNPRYLAPDLGSDSRDKFKSRIIEEFEARIRGLQLEKGEGNYGPGEITRSQYARQSIQSDSTHQNAYSAVNSGASYSLDRKGIMGGVKDRSREEMGYSLDRVHRKQDRNSFSVFVSDRRALEENHYDSPRSLLSKSSYTDAIGSSQTLEKVKSYSSPDEDRIDSGIKSPVRKQYSGPPSISMGVWGEHSRGSVIKIKEDRDIKQTQPVEIKLNSSSEGADTNPKQVQQSKPILSSKIQINPSVIQNKIPGNSVLSWQSHTTNQTLPRFQQKPELAAKPIEIRYKDRTGVSKEIIQDPKISVISASRRKSGAVAESVQPQTSERRWRDELVRDIDSMEKKILEKKISDSKISEKVDWDDVVLRRSKDSSSGDEKGFISHNNLVQKRRSQIEGDRVKHEPAPWEKKLSHNANKIKDQVQISSSSSGKEVLEINREPVPAPPPLPTNRFYFGMNGARETDTYPSLPTAVGKVKENQTLAQPFRKPRELIVKDEKFSRPRLSTATFTPPENNNSPSLLNGNLERKPSSTVPTRLPDTLERKPSSTVPTRLPDTLERKPSSTVPARFLDTLERKPSSVVPPKELPQEEINRAFTAELMKAKQKLKYSGRAYIQDEVQVDGVLPPPPPPILPGVNRKVSSSPSPPPPPPPAPFQLKKSSRALPPPNLDPRDDLLAAIRRAGGVAGLKKTRT